MAHIERAYADGPPLSRTGKAIVIAEGNWPGPPVIRSGNNEHKRLPIGGTAVGGSPHVGAAKISPSAPAAQSRAAECGCLLIQARQLTSLYAPPLADVSAWNATIFASTFSVFHAYPDHSEFVIIVAVAHNKRKPGSWQKRI